MKKLNLKIKSILIIASIIFTISCSKENEINIPTVSYSSTTIDATFFEAGVSMAPTILWNGNEGLFSITTSLEGLSINPNSGVLSWTKALPNGKHPIDIVVTNSAGQTTINVTLDNTFQGVFIGKLGSCLSELEFKKDGTFSYTYAKGENIIGNGFWESNSETVIANYVVNEEDFGGGISVDYSLKGNIVQTLTKVDFVQQAYYGKSALSGEERGAINTTTLGYELPEGDGVIMQLEDGRYSIISYGGCSGACCWSTLSEARAAYPQKTLSVFP